jgi:dTDP-4-amino-4,6-dideoxygalactose transaminase
MKSWKVLLSEVDLGDEELEAVRQVLMSKWLSYGIVTEQFERRFSDYLGVKHAIAVASGSAALHLACLAAGVMPGDEVIVPSLTFAATANSVLYCGAKPVFADVTSLEDLNISPLSIAERITPRTKAIIVLHYGGYPANMSVIMEIARQHNLTVIEDAAHAPGARYGSKKCGAIGDIGCFSFFANKNLVTGEGGMVVTDRDPWADRMRILRSHGMTTLSWHRYQGRAISYDIEALGYNYRTTDISSAIGSVQLGKLETNNRRRHNLVRQYVEELPSTDGFLIPFRDPEGESSYHLFPILLPKSLDRDSFVREMAKNGIQTSVHYKPIHLLSYYRSRFPRQEAEVATTEEVGRRVVTLPLHPLMSDTDIRLVAASIRTILDRHRDSDSMSDGS